MCTSCRISLWWWFECRQGLLPACLRGRTSAKLFLYIENSWRVMLGDKRDPLGGPISLVRRVVLGSALACAGTACATSPSSTGRHVWTMQSSESGRVVHLDSAVVGEWQICFWYDSLTLQTRHPRPNPHCGALRVTGQAAQFVAVDASFSGFIVRFSRSTVPPCARTGLPNERQGTLIPDFYGVSVHLELPAFQFWSGESDYVAATGSVRGDSLVGKWMSRDSTCAGDGDELFVMSPRH